MPRLVGANKLHLLANREALPALGRALSNKDAELRLNAASALWALVYDNQKAKATVKKLASQVVINLAPSVVDAATKPVDPGLAAAAGTAQGSPGTRRRGQDRLWKPNTSFRRRRGEKRDPSPPRWTPPRA